jgi:hypothetical protein
MLAKKFGYKATANIRNLAKWAGITDEARFDSAKQTVELKEPALQICDYIKSKSVPGGPLIWLIKAMKGKSLAAVVKDKRITNEVKIFKSKIEKSLNFHRRYLQIFDKVCFIDLTKTKVERVKFAAHYLFPSLTYVVTLYKSDGFYRLAVGGNPWRPNSCKYDLGKLLRRKYGYGAGGHERAGGIAGIENKKKAETIARDLIEILNK